MSAKQGGFLPSLFHSRPPDPAASHGHNHHHHHPQMPQQQSLLPHRARPLEERARQYSQLVPVNQRLLQKAELQSKAKLITSDQRKSIRKLPMRDFGEEVSQVSDEVQKVTRLLAIKHEMFEEFLQRQRQRTRAFLNNNRS